MNTITSEIVELTPELAVQYLKRNIRNRAVSPYAVIKLAAAIERGEWQMNGDAIKISRTGALLDGQHRCAAVIKANRAIQTMVVSGLESDVQTTMDLGRSRTLADLLRMDGVKDYATVGATVSMVLRLNRRWALQDEGMVGNSLMADTDTVLSKYAEYNANAARYDAAVVDCRRLYKALRWPSSSLGALAFFAQPGHPDEWENFVVSVSTGENLLHGDPALALRNAADSRRPTRGSGIDQMYAFALSAKAWNFFVSDQTATRITFAMNGSRREQIPRVI